MISENLLSILVCPETRQSLKLAEDSLLEELNRRIERGDLENRGGQAVKEALGGGLVREDGTLLYPVRKGIPVMLVDEAIELEARDPGENTEPSGA